MSETILPKLFCSLALAVCLSLVAPGVSAQIGQAGGRYPLEQLRRSPNGTAWNSNSPSIAEPVAKDLRPIVTTAPMDSDFSPDPGQPRLSDPTTQNASFEKKLPDSPGDQDSPGNGLGTTKFTLAGQPKLGDSFFDQSPDLDRRAALVETHQGDFSADPILETTYDAGAELWPYSGKTLNATQRPLVELGRPWYQFGQLASGRTFLGRTNLVNPQVTVFGDFRIATVSNSVNGDNQSLIAAVANLNFDLRITATERFHFFISPLDQQGRSTRWLFDEDRFDSEFDPNVEFGFFEGDLGAIVGGVTKQTLPFDLPFAAGFMPLVFQNGIWFEDAIIGLAATIPSRNSPRLDISNMDTTFFWGFDELNSPAFEGNDDVAKIYGVANFIEAAGGYFELDYAYLEDRNTFRDRSYHNIGVSFTRRYGSLLSNSLRLIANAGQSTQGGPNTADGFVVLIENSLVTSRPATFVPYCNLFFGSDRPQSVARDAGSGGILRNTGILFESDAMTGYPTLDATANDSYGGAIGLNMIAADLSQQLVLEAAMLQVHGNDTTRIAAGDQYGIGFRYQRPLSNSVILRLDGMIGFLEDADDIRGVRVELRKKF